MACNAWNHEPDCTCGWGGEGYSRTGALPVVGTAMHISDALAGILLRPSTIRSYTVPNAHCPVCGATVFFYQSPYGGRTFFDELGPPWPKHPCTDNNGNIVRVSGSVAPRSSWSSVGWAPFLIVSIERFDPELLMLEGKYNDLPLRVYVKQSFRRYGDLDGVTRQTAIHMRRMGGDRFELSFLWTMNRPATIHASTVSFDARQLSGVIVVSKTI